MHDVINALYQTNIYFHKIGMNNHNGIHASSVCVYECVH